ncbi:MAG: TIGR02147 family protein [Chitinivibrionales bacterium]|nr:TIGR02147 family protein [Chitinivibrionales bacterium]MBD3395573.1 TIGR02147 family protein [Chitinivibrionales bacterium]
MPDIFLYTDYRNYLRDLYDEKKAEQKSFSYHYLSRKAGLRNKGFLHNVIHGRKNLSKVSVLKLAKALELSEREAQYFENLVFFNQAGDHKTRNMFFEKLCEVKLSKAQQRRAKLLREDQYEYFSTWYHSAVRSLVDMFTVREGDTEWISEHVYPKITMLQAQRSLKLLQRLGLIELDNKGIYCLTARHISTGNELLDVAALNFYRETADLAKNSIDHLPRHARNVSGVTVGISRKAYEEIVDEINAFRKRIVSITNRDEDSDRVYQLCIHMFPMSKTNIRKRNV